MELTGKEIITAITENSETYYKTESGDKAKVYVHDLARDILKLVKNHGVSHHVSETDDHNWFVEIVRGNSYLAKNGKIKPAIKIADNGVYKLVAPREDLYSR